MRLTGSQIVAGLLILLSTLIAFLLNIATNNLPTWMQHHTSLTWFLLIPSVVLFAYITAKTSNPAITILQIGEERRSEEHTSELQSHLNLVCRLLLEKKKMNLKDTLQYYLMSTEVLYI